MNTTYRYLVAVSALAMATQAAAQITLYEHSGLRGASVRLDRPVGSLEQVGFNNAASSAMVSGEPGEVCNRPGFAGRCIVLRPGQHRTLGELNDGVSSARPVSSRGAHGYPQPGYAQPGYAQQPVYQPQPSGVQITFYERRDFRGRSFTAGEPVGSFERYGFNDRASSAVIAGGSWEVCDDRGFRGNCAVLRPGRYASLQAMGLNNSISSARPAAVRVADSGGPGGRGQVTLYEHAGLRGQSITLDRSMRNFERFGFNNSASSVIVVDEPWELCEGPGFSGRCVVLRPGRYNSLGSAGLNDSVSSARPAHR